MTFDKNVHERDCHVHVLFKFNNEFDISTTEVV